MLDDFTLKLRDMVDAYPYVPKPKSSFFANRLSGSLTTKLESSPCRRSNFLNSPHTAFCSSDSESVEARLRHY